MIADKPKQAWGVPSSFKVMKWKVTTFTGRLFDDNHHQGLEDMCNEGWEPFGVAVTGPDNMVTTWFRRQVEVPYERPKGGADAD